MMSLRSSLRLVFLLAISSALLRLLCRVPGRLPQVASGGNVLSVVFGDAKLVLSSVMVSKADSYFHGGVDMDCPDCHEHEEHCRVKAQNGNFRGREGSIGTVGAHTDPWRWLNDRIRAPEVERHLEGKNAVQMMPWFWASVKADPHNIEAWTAAWYTAAHVMKDYALARRVLDEAKAKNPDSPEIALTEGQFLYQCGEGDLKAAEAAFLRTQSLALAKVDGDVGKLGEADRRAYDFAASYLKDLMKRREGRKHQ